MLIDKFWIPATKIKPIKTFPNRLAKKNYLIISDLYYLFRANLGFSGAKIINVKLNYNELKMNSKSPLGGSYRVPKDQVIYLAVRKFGCWSLKTSDIFSKLIYIESKKSNLCTFIDIGAHVGLISAQILQRLRFTNVKINIMAFEPNNSTFVCLISNLGREEGVELFNFGLGEFEESVDIYIHPKNTGHVTTKKDNLLKTKTFITERVSIKPSSTVFNNYNTNSKFIKIDTEGAEMPIMESISYNVDDTYKVILVELWKGQNYNDIKIKNIFTAFKQYIIWDIDRMIKVNTDQVTEYLFEQGKGCRDYLFIHNSLSGVDINYIDLH